MSQDLFSNTQEIEKKPVRNELEKEEKQKLFEKMVKQRDETKFMNGQSYVEPTMAQPKEKAPRPLKAYTYNEALEKATAYFNGDSLAASVWLNKYALKDSDSNIYELSPDDMHHRLAREIARIEQKYPNPIQEEEVFELLRDFRYIVPQGSPMAGIGNPLQISSLSNCFVIGNDGKSDSYGGILKIDQEQVQLMKRRGGVGHDLSHIRPAGSPVKNSALTSTGIVPFMERYSNSTREVAQDGRRGALMLSVSVKHPDSEKFIDAKMQDGKVTGANVSVKIDDEFMNCLKAGKPYVQQFPVDAEHPKVKKQIDPTKLWNKIIHNAWKSAEPGVLFWDTVSREAIPDCYADLGFKTVSTNPCGEIPLCPYDSCRLLAINLYSYVENPFTNNARFNADLFAKHSAYALRFMDDIIDLEIEKIDAIIQKIDSDPEDESVKSVERKLWLNIRDKTKQGRRTGIGITAEGDMLAALDKKYGSEEATNFSVEVHKLLATEVYRQSVKLARERGPFPIFEFKREVDNPFINRIATVAPEIVEDMRKYGRRNIAMLTIAPTGSVSICTQTSSGIEPVFMVSYKRRKKVNPNDQQSRVDFVDNSGDSWQEYRVFHHNFSTWLKQNNHNPDEVAEYTDDKMNEIIASSPFYQATANDINWVNKVKMQGAIQKWVDHSISVTVNVPKDTSEALVSDIYRTAWESGCKGMTIYRDGSRSGVLVSSDKNDDNDFKETKAPHRPERLEADVVRFQNAREKWVAVVGLYKKRPYEIFTGKAEGFFLPEWVDKGSIIRVKNEDMKQARYDFEFTDNDGYTVHFQGLSREFDKEFWNYAKLISGILRHGMPLPYVADLISKLGFETDNINTWKKGVVRALKKFIPDGTSVAKDKKCPECGDEEGLIYKEGCLTCKNCGFTKCE